MSFITEQIQRIDAHLDHAQFAHHPSSAFETTASRSSTVNNDSASSLSPRILALQTSIRALSPVTTGSVSTTNASKLLLKPSQIQHLLSSTLLRPPHPSYHPYTPSTSSSTTVARSSGLSVTETSFRSSSREDDEAYYNDGSSVVGGGDVRLGDGVDPRVSPDGLDTELSWLLVSKATTQVYGHVLSQILATAVRLEDEIWYWDDVLGSPRATALYSAQTSPARLLGWGRGVWGEVVARTGGAGIRDGLRRGWREFYALVRDVVRDRARGVEQVRAQVLGPLRRLREEIRRKQVVLRKMRSKNANGLGVLLGEGLANESFRGDGVTVTPTLAAEGLEAGVEARKKWRKAVARNVALMEAVLAKVNDLETPIDKFDDGVADLTDDDPLNRAALPDAPLAPQVVASRLVRVLAMGLPDYADSTRALIRQHGRPSRIVRYWLPVTVGILTSSTALRAIFNRKAQIVQGIQDLGTTILDFWTNWVVEPTRNLIKTIRHDEGSEISIMSKRSLEGDRESLERMVVDFAIDNPSNATGSNARLTDAEIADIRAKVREGDLTPVLKAYEKDLASPLMGTLRGNLIRALLIQIQKTKVDVEVAMGGIDALLKSQELCIGIIGLTPGLLITYFLLRWVRNSFSEKRGSQAILRQGKMVRQLRNIDRILTNSTPSQFGELVYRDQGLLLCEAHVLRQTVAKTMPSEIYKEFGEEVDELCDIRVGASRQKHVVERIRWAYAKWLA